MRTKIKITSDFTSLLDVVLIILFAFLFLRVEQKEETVTQDELKETIAKQKQEIERLKERATLEDEIKKKTVGAFMDGRIVTMEPEILDSVDNEGRLQWKLHIDYKNAEIAVLESNEYSNMTADLAEAFEKAGIEPESPTLCFFFYDSEGKGHFRAREMVDRGVGKLEAKGYDLIFEPRSSVLRFKKENGEEDNVR